MFATPISYLAMTWISKLQWINTIDCNCIGHLSFSSVYNYTNTRYKQGDVFTLKHACKQLHSLKYMIPKTRHHKGLKLSAMLNKNTQGANNESLVGCTLGMDWVGKNNCNAT